MGQKQNSISGNKESEAPAFLCAGLLHMQHFGESLIHAEGLIPIPCVQFIGKQVALEQKIGQGREDSVGTSVVIKSLKGSEVLGSILD